MEHRNKAVSSPSSLAELSVCEAAKAIRRGRLKSQELVEALLDAIKANQHLNAFISVEPQAALKAAREADARAARSWFMGPLHGVPLVVKDNIHVAGFPSSAGTPAMRGFRPQKHAAVVQRLVNAGALVLGKTNLHELGLGVTSNNPAFGPVRNPYDLSRIAGGSSGGTASAVAARLAPAGLGTDTGGSLRIPAALCGVAALRPTLDRYPQGGITPIARTRDTVGPMARTVKDLALLDSVMARTAYQVLPARLKGLRIGLHSYFFDNLDRETENLTLEALSMLRDAGVELVAIDIPQFAELSEEAAFAITLFEMYRDLGAYLRQYAIPIDLETLPSLAASRDVKGMLTMVVEHRGFASQAYKAARRARRRLQALYAQALERNKIAALAFPTTPLTASAVHDDRYTKLNGVDVPIFATFTQNTASGSINGIPGMSLPIGSTKAGLPVGLAFDGVAGQDAELLCIGIAIEQIFGCLPAPRSSVTKPRTRSARTNPLSVDHSRGAARIPTG